MDIAVIVVVTYSFNSLLSFECWETVSAVISCMIEDISSQTSKKCGLSFGDAAQQRFCKTNIYLSVIANVNVTKYFLLKKCLKLLLF